MKVLRRALRFLLPYWHLQLPALLCALLSIALNLVQPWIFRRLVDDVFVRASAQSLQALKLLTLMWLGTMLFSAVIPSVRNYLFTLVGERAVIDLRNTLFRHMQRLPLAHFTSERVGRLMSTFNNDAGAMQGLYTSTLVDLITNALQFVFVLSVLVSLNWRLGCLALPVYPLFGLSIYLFSKPLREMGRKVQERAAQISEHLQESIAGVREVKAFTQEPRQARHFLQLCRGFLGIRLRQTMLGSTNNGFTTIIGWGGGVLILWQGGKAVIGGELTAGTLVQFLMYYGNLFGPTYFFANLNVVLQGAIAGAERVFQFLDLEPAIQDQPDAQPLPPIEGRVEFCHVTFAYNGDKPALNDINFIADAGKVIALVGPSGGGKSTLVSLIPRFYDPTQGRVLIDGCDLRDVTQESLRAQIAQVFQENFLFAATVKENLQFGRTDATDEAIIAAAKAANAHEFIMALAKGYNTEVGERGVKLSGGQKQRIALARAILRDPKVLILDEATSALDSESEAAIQDALQRLMVGRTSFVIAHRLSTILNADEILVLDAGRLVERGTHAELLSNGQGVYRRLYAMQFESAAVEA